jgi:alkylhydroperoxidase family enzyme
MARISGLPEQTNLFTRLAYALTRRRLGRMVETVAVSAHHPRLLLGAAAFEQALGSAHRLDDRVKALAVLQAASRIGCPF